MLKARASVMWALVLAPLACGDKEMTSGFASAGTLGTTGPTGSSGTSADPTTGATGTGTSTSTSGTGSGTGSSTAGSSSGATGSTSEGTKFDLGGMPDVGMVECVDCSLTIASMQSGVIQVDGPKVFATAQLQGQIVYAMGTYGAGRFIATADTSLPFNEQTDCPIVPWLAGTQEPNPTLFWFGWGPSDGPKQWNYPGMSAGIHLPPEYIGDPAKLRAEFDMVMYLEGSGQFDNGDQPSDEEMQTILDYVSIHGGGVYVSSEFAGYLKTADYVSVNRLLVPMGVTALEVNLDWGNVDGQIDFTCFPAPPA